MPRSFARSLVFALLALGLARTALGADPAAPAPSGVRTIYLIRHGIYDPVTGVDERVGNGLNPLGREQAALIGARLGALPVRMTTLVSSTLMRARETADLMAGPLRMSVARDPLLSECSPASGRVESAKGPSAAGTLECEAQLESAWEKYVCSSPEADRHDVLVCHGNVIRWFVAKALGMDSKQWTNLDIANGSLTVIYVRPDGRTRLAVFSDVGHLPVEKQTWSSRGGGWSAALKKP